MTPERWELVAELFQAALECPPHERSALLTRLSAGDDALKSEVESLIEEHERSGAFLHRPPIEGRSLVLDAWQQAAEAPVVDPHLDTTIANRYRIETGLGRGGQALVYLARDLMLMSKPVVVKILASAPQQGWSGGNVRHEIAALSRIDHPGVVGVLDTGTLPDGSPFLVMQYAEGETLRQTLKSGALERTRAAAILRQIGAALEAAHDKGIVHGDLKPENIVLQRLSDGSELVKLIDFGIATIDKIGGASRTTGPIAGSVRYMAPEQFRGETSRASDLYAVGLLACEMLCGLPAVGSLRAGRRVTSLVREALASLPEDRPPSAKAWCERVADALLYPRRRTMTRVAAALAAASVLAAWAAWRRAPAAPDGGAVEIRTLAVLPFQMIGASADEEALEMGVADGLITRLSNISGLTVRPIATVRRYNAESIDPVRAAGELQVDAVVEGTLRPSERGMRANVRLIRARDGSALWAGTIESEGRRLSAFEESIAQQIALNVTASLTDSERGSLETRRPLNPDAHELYVKGRFEWGKRSRDGLEKAAEYFRRAVDLDPTYARAHVGLADCYLLLGGFGYYPPAETLPKAKALASRALELDPSLGEAHTTLAFVSQHLDWNWANVESHYRQAISLAPNYATAHHWYAEFLSFVGRFEESRHAFAQARRIDPISPMIQVDEAQLYYFEREYDRSLEILRHVARLDPAFELVHNRIAYIYVAQGRDEEAWNEIQLMRPCGEETSDCRRIWTASLPRRNPAAARSALKWMEAEAKKRLIAPTILAHAYLRQGEYDRALDSLENHLDWYDAWLITIKVSPMFDPLRTHPRFNRILQKVNLAD